jgi:hypothetical protein
MNRPLALLLALVMSFTASAATTKPAVVPAEIKLTLHPAPINRPTMRYRLLPDKVDLTPGNAAVLYLVAEQLIPTQPPATQDDLSDWAALPAGEIPRPKADDLLKTYAGALHQLDLAARREECHWEMPFHSEGWRTLLPYLSQIRTLARALALQAHLQIADHKYAEAARSLQTGFALVYHLNHDAVLVQTLVGVGVAAVLLDQVDFWIATPGSPNLYWPLTDLPQPICDIRAGFAMERSMTYDSIPHFREALAGKLTPEGMNEIVDALSGMRSGDEKPDALKTLTTAARLMVLGPTAKEWLMKRGYTQGDVDAMQPSQLIGLYLAQSYDEAAQEIFKWAAVPYWQGIGGLSQADDEIKANEANLIVRVVLPSTNRAAQSLVQAHRRIEELRIIEAIRAHAAAHGGEPPATLADIANLPLPIDPGTGKPFTYTRTPSGFTLDAALLSNTNRNHGRHYEVQLQK